MKKRIGKRSEASKEKKVKGERGLKIKLKSEALGEKKRL